MRVAGLSENADFWAGVMFVGFGAAAVFFSQEYPMGTAMRMGPGYFPHYLGLLMMLIGSVVGIRGLMHPGERIGTWGLRPILALSLGILLFGLSIESLGFVPALAILIVASALAGRELRVMEVPILLAVLIAGAVGIFIYGIGLPYRLFWWD